MKWNFVIVFLLVVAAALSAVYFKVDQDFYSEKIQWNEAQSRAQMSVIGHALESEFDRIASILDLTYLNLSGQSYEKSQPYGQFEMITSFRILNNEIQFDKKFFVEQSAAKSWGASYAFLTLKSLKESELKANSLMTLLDPQRRPWLMAVVPSKNTDLHYAVILKTDFVQSLVDRQKGQMSTIAIVNSMSQVLGHSTSEYVGSLLKEDQLVHELMKSGNASGSGLYYGLHGERVHGFYEQVDQSNLFVTLSTPIRVLMSDRTKIKLRFLMLGIGISLIGVALLLFLNRKADEFERTSEEEVPVAAQEKVSSSNIIMVLDSSLNVPQPQAPPPPVHTKLQTQLNEVMDPNAKKRVEEEKKFKELFNDRKIAETMCLIDDLDAKAVPKAPPLIAEPQKVKILEAGDAMSIANFEITPPPVATGAIIRDPQITIHRKITKLDHLEVHIRKPGELS